jgi:hypothetical protein
LWESEMGITWSEVERLTQARDASHALEVWAANLQTYGEAIEMVRSGHVAESLPTGTSMLDVIGGEYGKAFRSRMYDVAYFRWEMQCRRRLVAQEMEAVLDRIVTAARSAGVPFDRGQARFGMEAWFGRDMELVFAEAVEKALRPRSITEIPNPRRGSRPGNQER